MGEIKPYQSPFLSTTQILSNISFLFHSWLPITPIGRAIILGWQWHQRILAGTRRFIKISSDSERARLNCPFPTMSWHHSQCKRSLTGRSAAKWGLLESRNTERDRVRLSPTEHSTCWPLHGGAAGHWVTFEGGDPSQLLSTQHWWIISERTLWIHQQF